MRFCRALILVGAISLSAIRASAGILFEPYAGYDSTTFSYDLASDGTTNKFTMNGLTYGARLGYETHMFFIAGDYDTTSSMSSNASNSSGTSGSAQPFVRTDIFGVIGVRLSMFRIYGGYGFSSTLDYQDPAGDTKYTGTSYKVGVSYVPLHWLSINVEYLMHTYTQFSSGGVTQSIDGTYISNGTGNSILATVGFPLEWPSMSK